MLNAGVQRFNGDRTQSDSETSKDNLGWFLQGQYAFDALTLSGGVRRERVEYAYTPVVGAALEADERLTSWELGANYRLDPALSLFASYSDAFLAPDIDRFFSTDWSTYEVIFNGFIEPAQARTVTLGINHLTDRNRLKLSVFHARLENEIYLEPISYMNTNIDKSHKYGLELQDSLQITPNVIGLVNYAWTRAIIDREADGGGAYEARTCPGSRVTAW